MYVVGVGSRSNYHKWEASPSPSGPFRRPPEAMKVFCSRTSSHSTSGQASVTMSWKMVNIAGK